jgi:hypothetical protein
MEEEIINLKALGTELETLSEVVSDQSNKIKDRTEVQEDKVRKLWAAYTSMENAQVHYNRSILDPIVERMHKTLDDAPYWEVYRQTNDELDRLLGLLKDKDNSIEMLKETEKVIVEILTLLNFKWELLVFNMEPVNSHIKNCKDAENSTVEQYKEIEPNLEDTPEGLSVKRTYLFEQERLMLEQMLLFKKEQSLLDQMKFICDEKDRMFSISSGLFLK